MGRHKTHGAKMVSIRLNEAQVRAVNKIRAELIPAGDLTQADAIRSAIMYFADRLPQRGATNDPPETDQ